MNNLNVKHSLTLIFIIGTLFLSACNLHKAKQQSWVLNKTYSTISITTTKNNSISEVSEFTTFTGTINASNYLEISIDLNSLETNIPIRNERIEEHLFKTQMFPTADIHTQLTPQQLENGVHSVTFDVDLHGLSSIMTADFMVFEHMCH